MSIEHAYLKHKERPILYYLQAFTPKKTYIILEKSGIFCKKIFILAFIHCFQ